MLKRCPPPLRGLKVVGTGCYATVYASRDGDYVIKRGRNDGTRTYLEWVVQRTLQGKRMLGMPWVESLTDDGRNGYIAIMRRYESLDAIAPQVSNSIWDWGVNYHPDVPRYIERLVAAFEREGDVSANDLHSGNVMADDNGEWIVTDPSADDYVPITVH